MIARSMGASADLLSGSPRSSAAKGPYPSPSSAANTARLARMVPSTASLVLALKRQKTLSAARADFQDVWPIIPAVRRASAVGQCRKPQAISCSERLARSFASAPFTAALSPRTGEIARRNATDQPSCCAAFLLQRRALLLHVATASGPAHSPLL